MTRPVALPVRIQLRRKKDFRLQEVSKATNGLPAVNVAGSSKWGNFYRIVKIQNPEPLLGKYRLLDSVGNTHLVASKKMCAMMAVYLFRRDVILEDEDIVALRGKNLACWCGPDDPCHADVLIELANKEIGK